jgi:hypothetical protein
MTTVLQLSLLKISSVIFSRSFQELLQTFEYWLQKNFMNKSCIKDTDELIFLHLFLRSRTFKWPRDELSLDC